MELNKIYIDQYNNKIQIISDDYTGLNRNIVYAQNINKAKRIITKKEFVNETQNNIYNPKVFAIWHWEYKNYTLIS